MALFSATRQVSLQLIKVIILDYFHTFYTIPRSTSTTKGPLVTSPFRIPKHLLIITIRHLLFSDRHDNERQRLRRRQQKIHFPGRHAQNAYDPTLNILFHSTGTFLTVNTSNFLEMVKLLLHKVENCRASSQKNAP